MYSKNPHVLIVDDNADFAKEYAETLELQCKIKTLYASNTEDAIKFFKENPIKVVILDQVMPTKGTELFAILKKLDPKVKTILLTAEADKHDLTLVTNIGFDYALLKEEDDMNSLPSKVLLLIMHYNAMNSPNSETPFYIQKIGNLFHKEEISYAILHYDILDPNYCPEDSWLTRNMIERGETLDLSQEFNIEEEFNYSDTFQISDGLNMGLESSEIIKFKNDLSSKMAQDFKNTYTESIRTVLKRNIKLQIPEDSHDVISRVYEYAKVYSQIKVYLKKTCTCCKSTTIDAITVYLPIPTVKYRIKEYYSDGNYKILNSGEIKGK